MDNIYIPYLQPGDTRIELTPDVQRHLSALRLRHGEQIRALNGRGLCTVCTVGRDKQTVWLTAQEHSSTPRPRMLTLAMSVLDSRDRFEFALEKATELGITRFVPLLAKRSQHHRVHADRLVAKAVAAITQCGVAWLPEIAPAVGVEDLPRANVVIVGDDTGDIPAALQHGTESILVVVGPEGDLTPEEKSYLHNTLQAHRWAIGQNRLRAETAAIALLSNVVCR